MANIASNQIIITRDLEFTEKEKSIIKEFYKKGVYDGDLYFNAISGNTILVNFPSRWEEFTDGVSDLCLKLKMSVLGFVEESGMGYYKKYEYEYSCYDGHEDIYCYENHYNCDPYGIVNYYLDYKDALSEFGRDSRTEIFEVDYDLSDSINMLTREYDTRIYNKIADEFINDGDLFNREMRYFLEKERITEYTLLCAVFYRGKQDNEYTEEEKLEIVKMSDPDFLLAGLVTEIQPDILANPSPELYKYIEGEILNHIKGGENKVLLYHIKDPKTMYEIYTFFKNNYPNDNVLEYFKEEYMDQKMSMILHLSK